ncbi:hypothetical protein TNCT_517801 [Trichonephila clavata]|uniref:Uncharacterized protein n=1 Tax=Trichonephila clavata TaxID=2740835 RepID=A0A8X6FR59_TRICU|nr:hypothetical protein TNCT_517801 [Trichonephila clavata]
MAQQISKLAMLCWFHHFSLTQRKVCKQLKQLREFDRGQAIRLSENGLINGFIIHGSTARDGPRPSEADVSNNIYWHRQTPLILSFKNQAIFFHIYPSNSRFFSSFT